MQAISLAAPPMGGVIFPMWPFFLNFNKNNNFQWGGGLWVFLFLN
jgi:hypothetical protein